MVVSPNVAACALPTSILGAIVRWSMLTVPHKPVPTPVMTPGSRKDVFANLMAKTSRICVTQTGPVPNHHQ